MAPKGGKHNNSTTHDSQTATSAAADATDQHGDHKSGRLKTSEEVHHMIKTDARFNPQHCNVIYHDRVLDRMMSLSAAEWQPINQGGDVPWHRVYKFDYYRHVFWDRNTRTFNFQLLQRLAALDPAAAGAGGGSSSSLQQYQNSILAQGQVPEALSGTFRLASLNVLSDLRSSNVTKLEHRLPLISSCLEQISSDVILLQDCTSKVLSHIQSQPWVQNSYNLVHTVLNPIGLITLVRTQLMSAGQEDLPGNGHILRVTVPVDAAAAAAAGSSHEVDQHVISGDGSSRKLISIWNVQLPLASQLQAGSSSSSSGKRHGSSSRSAGGRGHSKIKIATRSDQLEKICQLAMSDCGALQEDEDYDSYNNLNDSYDSDYDTSDDNVTIFTSATDNARPYRVSNSTTADRCILAGDFKAAKQQDRDLGPFTLDNAWIDAWTAVQQQQRDNAPSSAAAGVGALSMQQPATAAAAAAEAPAGGLGSNRSSKHASSSCSSSSSSGYTYCPAENSLAKQLSGSGMSARYDRVLIHGDSMQATAASIFGNTKPVLSDHFGLLVTLRVNET